MSATRTAALRAFAALRVRNYRLYFTAQLISVSGTWMQTVAMGWLVLIITGSGVDLGVVTALQFLPMLLFGTWGGLVADRMDKRHLLYATQSSAAVLAVALGLLTLEGRVTILELYLFAVGLGFVNMFDNPARQTFVSEMVGRDLLPNAVSLNSVLMNSARVIGPSLAAGALVLFGPTHLDQVRGSGYCFLINAGSYVAVLIALLAMRGAELFPNPRAPHEKGQLREGFRYVWSQPGIRDPLLVMAVVGIFAFNFTVTLALFARFTFHADHASLYGTFTAAMGVGAILGGLGVAARSRPSLRMLSAVGLAFGTMICVVAVAPTHLVATIALVPMGACSIAFIATSNATLQLASDPDKRGRVMALFAIAFLGSTPIGAPLVGAVSSWTNPRVALAMGGVATLVAVGLLYLRAVRRRPAVTPAPAAFAAEEVGPPVGAPAGTSLVADEVELVEEEARSGRALPS